MFLAYVLWFYSLANLITGFFGGLGEERSQRLKAAKAALKEKNTRKKTKTNITKSPKKCKTPNN